MKILEYKDVLTKRKTKKILYYVDCNGCWICTSHSTDRDGYYRLGRNKKTYRLHRYIYTIEYGKIPEGLIVRHKCDNPACINPEHLEIGTIMDNIMDREFRGHGAKGIRNGMCKLREEDVKNIRKDNRSFIKIAKEYQMHPATISGIKNRKIWKLI